MRLISIRSMMTLGACLLAACSSPNHSTQAQQLSPSSQQAPLPSALPQTALSEQPVATGPQKNGPLFVPFRQEFVQENGALSPYLKDWALQLAEQRRIPFPTIEALLKQVRYEPQVLQLMAPAQGKRAQRNWPAYRARFTDTVRIDKGLAFWRLHQDSIEAIAQHYQVPASILVAIIGVETIYGHYMGDFSVLNALTNLGFSYPDPNRPDRAEMFRNQLADLIELHYHNKLDAQTVRGSFAGAMGLPQFMPTSIKNWAVDASNKGHVDLFASVPDALASIANFLNHHGWQAGLPVFIDISIPTTPPVAALVDGGLQPTLTWATLQETLSLPSPSPLLEQQKFGLIDLPDPINQNIEYRLATANFFALTAYNRSYFYASAVVDLACALEQGYYHRSSCSLWANL